MAATIAATKNKAAGFRLTKTSLKRKPVQEREIESDDAEASEHQQGPQNDQQAARGHLQRVHVRAEAAVKLEEALDAKRSQQEGHRQAERIHGQQQDALRDRALRGRQPEDDRQDRAHARRPAESEGKPDHERPPGSAAPLYSMQAGVGIERLDLEDPGQV